MIDPARFWYAPHPLRWPLLPLAGLYCAVVTLRRMLWASGLLQPRRTGVPVVVVGNITVGGTGKTPLIEALAQRLRARGLRPGLVARGYGGRAGSWPRPVRADSDPAEVGDEPVLLARRTGAPMAVGPDRVGAVQRLLSGAAVDVVLSDDGLQHYRLARDLEIAVIDGERRYGNGHCLPAGPLREPRGRLNTVDLILVNGTREQDEAGFELVPDDHVVSVTDPGQQRPLAEFRARPVHAVAGIGNPARFFATLRAAGIEVIEHPFPDHHRYTSQDLALRPATPILMTEKDAVKCTGLGLQDAWYLPVRARLDEAAEAAVDRLLDRLGPD